MKHVALPLVASSLILLTPSLNAQPPNAAPEGLAGRQRKASGAGCAVDSELVFTVTKGWVRSRDSSPLPLFKHSALLSKGGSWISLNVHPTASIPFGASDSRRPRYYAQVFSEAWRLPLYSSNRSGKTMLSATMEVRGHTRTYVVSAFSDLAEGKVVALCASAAAVAEVLSSFARSGPDLFTQGGPVVFGQAGPGAHDQRIG